MLKSFLYVVALIEGMNFLCYHLLGCWIRKARIIGAMIKAAALSTAARLNEDLSRCTTSLKNLLIEEVFFTAGVGN
jgi:hypothetical protein